MKLAVDLYVMKKAPERTRTDPHHGTFKRCKRAKELARPILPRRRPQGSFSHIRISTLLVEGSRNQAGALCCAGRRCQVPYFLFLDLVGQTCWGLYWYAIQPSTDVRLILFWLSFFHSSLKTRNNRIGWILHLLGFERELHHRQCPKSSCLLQLCLFNECTLRDVITFIPYFG